MGSARGREAARRNTRARFEQWAKNPACAANTLSAVHNVRMADVAAHVGMDSNFGQSPFAIARGDAFERSLFRNRATPLIEALVEKGVLPAGAAGFEDLRLKMNGGTVVRDLDEALDATETLIRRVAAATTGRRRAALPAVAAAATVRIPRGVMLPEAILIIDALVIRTDGERPKLIVGEVKTYPDRGGHTDPHDLAVARAQAGIYVHALQLVVERLGLVDDIGVATSGFLVLTSPGSYRPSVRAGEDLRYQAERARRGFELLEQAAQVLPDVIGDGDGDGEPAIVDLVAAVADAGTTYSEVCVSFCDLAPRCFRAALDAGQALVLGDEVQRFVGNIPLPRVEELLDGARPRDAAEKDLLRRIGEVDAMAAQL